MTVRILTGDCRELMRAMAVDSVDACVTDPPYHLTTNKPGGSGVASVNLDSPYGRSRIGTGNGAGGFMGKAWDGGDIAFQPETWAEVLRVLKPGGYLIAFGGTRTYHRLACAVEDAGFEIRDQIQWLFGSGFPKSRNLDGEHEGWGTALKPAHEPIVLARKPLIGTVAQNVGEHGVGALNIDGCRVPTEERPLRDARNTRNPSSNGIYGDDLNGSRAIGETTLGRWPANVVHDGSEEVLAAFPETNSGHWPDCDRSGGGGVGTGTSDYHAPGRKDAEGSAARFFYCAKASRADRDDGLDEAFAKTSGAQSPGTFQSQGTDKSARNNHPTVKPTDLMRWLVRLVTPPGGTVLDPFMGSGSTGRACMFEDANFIGIEREAEYVSIATARIAGAERAKTKQPDLFK